MAWEFDEDEWLDRHVGTMPLPELVDALNREFQGRRPPRTQEAVQRRANVNLHKLTEYTEGMTLTELCRVVGLEQNGYSGRRLVKCWIEPKLLNAQLIRGRGGKVIPGDHSERWQILDEDFERFLRDHPYAYDWQRFAPGKWRQIAELIARRSPWKTVSEFLRIIERNRYYWYAHRSEIPFKWRHHGGYRRRSQEMIHIDTVLRIKHEISARAQDRLAA